MQTLVGAGVLLTGLGLVFGALSIPSAAGYGGVGPKFLPWLVCLALLVCGGFIVWESCTGGFRAMDDAGSGPAAYWPGFVWMSAGLLANAALITRIGFILSCTLHAARCTLCFVLAVQGLKRAEGRSDCRPAAWLKDALIGLAVAAPVFWVFTQVLAITLTGLTSTAWL
ncbi:MAG: tripartite tricarboxylate transporter TctB family protein [Polaromonas sp.]|nr:tripartite tricarboxylate transporter TctB family protein [Polaromonas sp.]